MNTSPTFDDILEGVIAGIGDNLLPAIDNPKAQATAMMMQSLLQGLRQQLPDYDTNIAGEHNEMIQVFNDMAEALGDAQGPAADRIRAAASEFGQRAPLPMPVPRVETTAAHHELSRGLEQAMIDLDELQQAGDARADEALLVMRTHLSPRFVRDVTNWQAAEGFIGRG